jgi:hypothetical protein
VHLGVAAAAERRAVMETVLFVMRQRRDLPPITPPMLRVLQDLRDAKAREYPFQPLDGVHKRTLNALIERYWIFASDGLDGRRYTITEVGMKALKVYEPTIQRRDGICPDCGVNPKRVRRSGKVDGYCRVCGKRHDKRKRDLRISKNPDAMCPRCKKRPRHVHPGGSVCTYCRHCTTVLKRAAKRRKRKAQLRLVQSGGFIKCRKPGCDSCVHFTDKTVFDLCQAHWREYMIQYNDRRRPNSRAARARGR